MARIHHHRKRRALVCGTKRSRGRGCTSAKKCSFLCTLIIATEMIAFITLGQKLVVSRWEYRAGPASTVVKRAKEVVSAATTLPYTIPPPQEIILYKDAANHPRYCYWKPEENHLNGCYELMAPFLKGKPKWTLLGDSTMMLIFAFLAPLFPYHRKEGQRCHKETYFGFPANTIDMWTPPDHSISEGPIFYGVEHDHEFCSDCSGCNSAKKEAPFNRSLEYLSVEFARDVETPTANTKTTQETVALYLDREVGRQHVSDHVCVVNTGLHGMTIFNDTAKYVENNKWYIDLLLGSSSSNNNKCGSLVWISISATLELPPYNNKNLNRKLKEWNDSFREVLRNEYPQVFYIDIWDKSAVTEHNDNVHLHNIKYYQQFADTLFARLMSPPKLSLNDIKRRYGKYAKVEESQVAN